LRCSKITIKKNYDCVCCVLSKPHTGTTIGLCHGTQFGVPMRQELVTVCVGMRGDVGEEDWRPEWT